MPEDIVMPRLSDTMEEGTIAQWLKREGDIVRKGDAILEVETDKANMELQSYSDGVIQKIIEPDGATVSIGAVVGILGKPGDVPASATDSNASPARATNATARAEAPVDDRAPAAVSAGQQTTAAASPVSGGPTAPPSGNGVVDGGRVKATPLARKLARDHNLDLVALGGHGSGPSGRIVKLDIEQFLAQQPKGPAAAAPAGEAPQQVAPTGPAPTTATPSDEVAYRKPNRVQQIMARRLVESKTTVPHFYVTNEVDMAAAADLRKQLQTTFGDEGKVSYNDLIVRACALALRAMPEVNASWQNDQFALHSHVNVGVAVGLPDGLVVPVLKDADRKGLRELAAEARALVDKARNGKLSPMEMSGGTFTVSNLGMFDVEQFQAIINPPESAILAVGSIVDKPVAVDGQVVVRPRMTLSLSVDHRVIPGVPAAQFLQRVKQLLQEPLRLSF